MWPVIFFIEVGANFFDLSYGDGFTSLSIVPSMEWHSAMVEPDNNYVDNANEINIYFRLGNSDLDISSCYAEYKRPDLADFAECELDGDDGEWIATCDITDITTAGTYGPISLVIRDAATSQIVAENVAFGYFALLEGAETEVDDSLTVSLVLPDSAHVFVVEEKVSLSFEFTLDVEMYDGDYFAIDWDSKFTFEKLTLEWASVEDEPDSELFASMNGIDFEGDCIYIYGFAGQITEGASVSFTLHGFTAPSAADSGSDYSWSLEVQRFGTSTLRKRYKGTGPTTEVTAGGITVVSWAPVTTGITTDNIINDLTSWFKIVVKTDHDIPEDGYLTFTFANIDLCANGWLPDTNQNLDVGGDCGVWTDNSNLECVNDSPTVQTCTASDVIAAGTLISIYNLITLSGDLTVSDITLKNGDDATIDEYDGEFAAIGLASGVSSLGVVYAKIAKIDDDTSVYKITSNSGDYGLLVSFKASATITASTSTFSAYLPFVIGSASDNSKLAVKGTNGWNYKVTGLGDSYTYADETDGLTATTTTNTFSATSSRVTLPLLDSVANDNLIALVGSGTEGTDNLYLPKVPTQMKEMQQIVIILTTASTTYIYASTWGYRAKSFETDPEILLPCDDPSVAGMPAKITFTPDGAYSATGYTIRVDIDVGTPFTDNADFNEDDSYPTTASKFKINADGNLYYTASAFTTDPVTETVPLPEITADFTLTVTAFLVKSGSDDIQIFYGTFDYTIGTSGSSLLALGGLSDGDVWASQTITLTHDAGDANSDSSSTETAVDAFFVMLLPYGYTSSDSDLGTRLTSTSYFDFYYAYSAIVIDETADYSRSIDVVIPWFEATTTVHLYSLAGSLSPFADITCGYTSADVTTGNAGFLTYKSLTPTVNGKTWSNQKTDVTLVLTCSKTIYSGTSFTVVVDGWTGCDADPTITVDGISDFPTERDITSGKDITIKLTNCDIPEATEADGSVIGFTSVTGDWEGNNYLLWEDGSTNKATTIKKNTGIKEKVSNAEMWVFPDVVGSNLVYFGIDFTFDANIPYVPEGSTISISGTFEDSADASDDTWCNFYYTSASASGDVFTIVTGEELPNKFKLSCVIDLALNLDTETPDPVLVTVTEPTGVNIILDVSTTQAYDVNAEPEATVDFVVTPSNLDAGFPSIHEFNITFSAATGDSFIVHLDNTGYNAEAGETFEFEDIPNDKFLWAMNSDEEFVPCTTVHWVISCMVSGNYDVDETLSLYIYLNNPAKTGSWAVYVSKDTVNIDYQPEYLTADLDFSNTIGNDIDLYFADPDFSESEDFYTHNLELNAFIDIAAEAGSFFTVAFPYPYNFEEYTSETISCSLEFEDNSGDELVVVSVLDKADCELDEMGLVTFTLEEAQTFTTGGWTNFYIYDLITPDPKFEKREFKFEDNNENYVYYSRTFCVMYETEDDGVVSSSFDNLNAAFAGFIKSTFEPLEVNEGNNILVTPGTWSGPYFIKNTEGKLKVKDVEVSWKNNDDGIDLELNEDSYLIDYKDPWAAFYIGVASGDVEEGIYVIEWEIDSQTPFEGKEEAYSRPRNTFVEVSYEKKFLVILNPPVIYVPTSGWSMPINLQIERDIKRTVDSVPYDSIEIEFAEDDLLGLEFRPNPLVLDKDTTAGFVSIKCSECTADSVVPFGVSVGGEDADAFYMEKDSYSFISGSRYSTEATLELTVVDTPNPTSFSLNLNTDQVGLATLCVIGSDAYEKDPSKVEFETIFNNSFILGAETNTKKDLQGLKDEHEAKIKEFDEKAKDYREQSKWKLNAGRNVYYPAQVMILNEDDNDLGEFSMLVPNSKYYVYVYFDNFDGSEPALKTLEVTTDKTPPHARITMDFGENSVPTDSKLKATLQEIFGLPETNIDTPSDRRRFRGLADSTVYVYSDVSSDTSAYDTATENQNTIGTETSSTVTVDSVDEDSYEDGAFGDIVVWGTDNGIYITLNYTAEVDGSLVCTVEGNGTNLTSNQVYEGVNADGDEILQFIDEILEGDNYVLLNFTEEEISPYGTYHVSCIVCNDYPGTPSCSDVEDTDYEYTGEDDNSSGAEALVVAFAAYFLF